MCVDPHHLNRLVPAEGSSTEVVPPVKNYFRRFFYVIFCINNREWVSTHDSGICCSGSDFNCVPFGVATALAKKEKKEKKKMGTKQLVFCAMAVALAMVTSMLKVYSFPFGGSITLFSMLFICFVGYVYGPATGILTGAAYGVLQFIIEPYIYFPLQVLVDYPLAFGVLGLSGDICGVQAWTSKRLSARCVWKICICSHFRMDFLWRICLGTDGERSHILWYITDATYLLRR